MSETLDTQILQAIMAAVEDLNMGLPNDAQVSGDLDEPLLGESGNLSSLDTVNFLAIVEDNLNAKMPEPIGLIERLMEDAGDNPPATIRKLAQYVRTLY